MRRYRAANPAYVAKERVRSREHRRKHADKYLTYALERQKAGREFINTFKSGLCVDCDTSYPPYIMDFDHVRGEKLQNVGEMGCYAIESIIEEISKCDLVCSNCHRARTYKRQHPTEFD